MAKITIFYGEMGSGKSYSARRMALTLGYDFYEGDDAVTPAMQRYILKTPIPKDVLYDFMYRHFVPEVHIRACATDHLVVAQALYRQEHRDGVRRELESLGHQVEYVLVKVPAMQNLRQLLGRKYGVFWVAYWLMNHAFFEE